MLVVRIEIMIMISDIGVFIDVFVFYSVDLIGYFVVGIFFGFYGCRVFRKELRN